MPPKRNVLQSELDGEYWSRTDQRSVRVRVSAATSVERYETEPHFEPVCTFCGKRASNWLMQPMLLRAELAKRGLIFCINCARRPEHEQSIYAIKDTLEISAPLGPFRRVKATPVSLAELAAQTIEPRRGEGLPQHLLQDALAQSQQRLRPQIYYQSKKGHRNLEKLQNLYKLE